MGQVSLGMKWKLLHVVEIRAYFESPERKPKYEKWKAAQEIRKSEDT